MAEGNTFEKEFRAEGLLNPQEQTPDQKRLEAFEERAMAEMEDLAGTTLRTALKTNRLTGALTEKGRLDVVQKSVRGRIFDVLGGKVSIAENSAESNLWKYHYPKKTLDALRERRYRSERVSLQPLQGFRSILAKLQGEAGAEIEAEREALEEISEHNTALRYLQKEIGERGIKETAWGWNWIARWKNRGVRKDIARVEKNLEAFDEAFEELNGEINDFENLKQRDITRQTEAFQREQNRLKTPDQKAQLWEAIQETFTEGTQNAVQGGMKLKGLMPEFVKNTSHADRVHIFAELGFDQSKSLEEAQIAQEQSHKALAEAQADQIHLDSLEVDYESCVRRLKASGAKRLKADENVNLDAMTTQMVAAVREAGITVLDDKSVRNEQRLLTLLANSETKPAIFDALEIGLKDQLLTWLHRTSESTSPNREISPDAEKAREVAEQQVQSIRDFATTCGEYQNFDDVKERLPRLADNQIQSFDTFLVFFRQAESELANMEMTSEERDNLQGLWKQMKDTVQVLQTTIEGWERDLKTRARNTKDRAAVKARFDKIEPKDRDTEAVEKDKTKARIENSNLDRHEKWQAEYEKALAEVDAKEPEFTNLKFDRFAAELEVMAQKTKFETPRRTQDILPPSARISKALRAPAMAEVEGRWRSQLLKTQQAQFGTLKNLPEGMSVSFAFSDMLRFAEPCIANAQQPNFETADKAQIIDKNDNYVTLDAGKYIYVVTNYTGSKSNVGRYSKSKVTNYEKGEAISSDQLPSKPDAAGISLAMVSPFSETSPASGNTRFGLQGGGSPLAGGTNPVVPAGSGYNGSQTQDYSNAI